MKSFARVAVFPVVTLLSIGVANAQPKPAVLSALPPQNFAFCLNTDATELYAAGHGKLEVWDLRG